MDKCFVFNEYEEIVNFELQVTLMECHRYKVVEKLILLLVPNDRKSNAVDTYRFYVELVYLKLVDINNK